MTIVATISSAAFFWTGVETLFACGFTAARVEDLRVRFIDAADVTSTLTRGVHYDAALDAEGFPQITPTLLMPAAPGTVIVDRDSEYTQAVEFEELRALSSRTNERLHDAHVRRLQELRRDIDALAARVESLPPPPPAVGGVDVWRLRVALQNAGKFFDVNKAVGVAPGGVAFEKWNSGGARSTAGDSLYAAIVLAIGEPAAAAAYIAAPAIDPYPAVVGGVEIWRLRVALQAAGKFFDVNKAIGVAPGGVAFEKWNAGGARVIAGVAGDSLYAAVVAAIGAPAAAVAYTAALSIPD